MLYPTALLADALADRLVDGYREMYGAREPECADFVAVATRLTHAGHRRQRRALSRRPAYRAGDAGRAGHPARPDAATRLEPADWAHLTLAMLLHDIGFVRGVCPGDGLGHCVVDGQGTTVTLPRGASDAWLAPYHVERGKIAVRARFSRPSRHRRRADRPRDRAHPLPGARGRRPCRHRRRGRAGARGGPDRPARGPALPSPGGRAVLRAFRDGRRGQARLRHAGGPDREVPRTSTGTGSSPISATALRCLRRTMAGKDWVAHLYANVFTVEHQLRVLGPEPIPRKPTPS